MTTPKPTPYSKTRPSSALHYIDLQRINLRCQIDYDTNAIISRTHWNCVINGIMTGYYYGYRNTFTQYLALQSPTGGHMPQEHNLVDLNNNYMNLKHGKKENSLLFYKLKSKPKEIILAYSNSHMIARSPTNHTQYLTKMQKHGVSFITRGKTRGTFNKFASEFSKFMANQYDYKYNKINLWRHYQNQDIAPNMNTIFQNWLRKASDHSKLTEDDWYTQYVENGDYVLICDKSWDFNKPPVHYINTGGKQLHLYSFEEALNLLQDFGSFESEEINEFKQNMCTYGWNKPKFWNNLAEKDETLQEQIEMNSAQINIFKQFIIRYKDPKNVMAIDIPLRCTIGAIWLEKATAYILNPFYLYDQKVPDGVIQCVGEEDGIGCQGVMYGKQLGYRSYNEEQIIKLTNDKYMFYLVKYLNSGNIGFCDRMTICYDCGQVLETFDSIFLQCNDCETILCVDCIPDNDTFKVCTADDLDKLPCIMGCGLYKDDNRLIRHYKFCHVPIQIGFTGEKKKIGDELITEHEWNEIFFNRPKYYCNSIGCNRVFFYHQKLQEHNILVNHDTCCLEYCAETADNNESLWQHRIFCPTFQEFAVNTLVLRVIDHEHRIRIAFLSLCLDFGHPGDSTVFLFKLIVKYYDTHVNVNVDEDGGDVNVDEDGGDVNVDEDGGDVNVDEDGGDVNVHEDEMIVVCMAHLIKSDNWSLDEMIHVWPGKYKYTKAKYKDTWPALKKMSLSGIVNKKTDSNADDDGGDVNVDDDVLRFTSDANGDGNGGDGNDVDNKQRIRRSERVIPSEMFSEHDITKVEEILVNIFRIDRTGQINKNKLLQQIQKKKVNVGEIKLEHILRQLNERNKIFYIDPMVHQI
eukprot:460874_1